MPEALQSLHQGAAHPVGVDVVEVFGAEFTIFLFALEQMIGDHQQLVGDGDDCPFGSAGGQPRVDRMPPSNCPSSSTPPSLLARDTAAMRRCPCVSCHSDVCPHLRSCRDKALPRTPSALQREIDPC